MANKQTEIAKRLQKSTELITEDVQSAFALIRGNITGPEAGQIIEFASSMLLSEIYRSMYHWYQSTQTQLSNLQQPTDEIQE